MRNQSTNLDVFVAVARHKSFALGGRELGMSRSATSKRVAALEARLGTRLLHRTTRQVALTPAGERLFERCAPLLDELHNAELEAAASQGEVVGAVRLAAPLAYGTRSVAPLVLAFCARHPRVQAEVAYNDRQVDVVADGFDLAVRGGILDDSALVGRRLRRIDVGLYASRTYLEQHGTPRAPADLNGHSLIGPTRGPLSLTREAERVVVKVEPRLIADNADVRLSAAAAGLGIALVPDFAVVPSVVRVLPDWGLSGDRSFWLVRAPGRAPRRAVEALADALFEGLR